MGTITLIILLMVEAFFLIWSIASKNSHRKEKSIVRISELLLLTVLLLTGILEWGFRYYMILTVLFIQSVIGLIVLLKKEEKPYRLGKNIAAFIRNGILITFALFLAILCPQYVQPQMSASNEVATAKYTWTNESMIEKFSDTGDNRSLTVEFWYPEDMQGTYPLVVFSHGAFGFSGSNMSTFKELASNGYVVASIGHTYHAFYTADTNGKITLVDQNFLNKVVEITNMNETENEQEVYNTTQEWMALRTADENFVLDTIISNVNSGTADDLFSHINTDKIGLFGHSMGGASSAQLGRTRSDIDSVIVIDGTMLGEDIGFENGMPVINDTPYPMPLLNIYAEDHYTNAMAQDGDRYENFNATKNASVAYEVVFKNAGHLNFTDLPLFSPTLANMLGVGTVDARDCIEKTNRIVLEFFNCYLKDGETPKFKKEY